MASLVPGTPSSEDPHNGELQMRGKAWTVSGLPATALPCLPETSCSRCPRGIFGSTIVPGPIKWQWQCRVPCCRLPDGTCPRAARPPEDPRKDGGAQHQAPASCLPPAPAAVLLPGCCPAQPAPLLPAEDLLLPRLRPPQRHGQPRRRHPHTGQEEERPPGLPEPALSPAPRLRQPRCGHPHDGQARAALGLRLPPRVGLPCGHGRPADSGVARRCHQPARPQGVPGTLREGPEREPGAGSCEELLLNF